MFPHLKGFNLQKWIDENRGDWGQRRVIWQDSDFIAFEPPQGLSHQSR